MKRQPLSDVFSGVLRYMKPTGLPSTVIMSVAKHPPTPTASGVRFSSAIRYALVLRSTTTATVSEPRRRSNDLKQACRARFRRYACCALKRRSPEDGLLDELAALFAETDSLY